MNKSFVVYADYLQHVELLSDEQAGLLFKAILSAVSEKELPEMDGATRMAFSFIRSQISRDFQKYEKVREKRSEAGKLGGRPKANGLSEKQTKAKKANAFSEKQTKAKKADTDTINDTVIKEKDAYASKKKSTGDPHGGQDEPCGNRIELSAGLELLPLADGTEWDCPMEKYQEYCRLYPGVDVAAEFRKMRGWCLEKPAKRKTRRGIGAFANGWLAREQDRYHPAAIRTDDKQGMTRDTDYNAVFGRGIGKILGGGE